MLGHINYKIDTENKLIYHVFHHSITVDTILKMVEKLIKELDYSPMYDALYDMQNCNLRININELPIISNLLQIDPKLNGSRNTIYLTNKPNEVVITTLYSKLLKNTTITPHIISTISAAQSLLSNHIEIDEIKKNLDSLREK